MQAKLYVGNLSYDANDDDLRALFSEYGTVVEVNLIRDKFTGQSKGFAFVQMQSSSEAEKALELTGRDFMGRNITVSEARPPKERPSHGRQGGSDRHSRGGGFHGRGRGSGGRRDY